jgi:hypothetical protein
MALRLFQKAMHAVRYWLLRRLPSCKELAPLMSQSLDRSLTLRERVVLKLHLWVCIWCVRYLGQLHFMSDILRARAERVSGDTPSSGPALSAAARERLRRSLKPPVL